MIFTVILFMLSVIVIPLAAWIVYEDRFYPRRTVESPALVETAQTHPSSRKTSLLGSALFLFFFAVSFGAMFDPSSTYSSILYQGLSSLAWGYLTILQIEPWCLNKWPQSKTFYKWLYRLISVLMVAVLIAWLIDKLPSFASYMPLRLSM